MFLESWLFLLLLSVVSRRVPGVTLVSLGVGGPQGQIVSQELHDQRRVLVRVLVEGVELSDRIVESLREREKCDSGQEQLKNASKNISYTVGNR